MRQARVKLFTIVLLVIFVAIKAAAADEVPTVVDSAAAFRTALLDASVTTIQLASSLKLPAASWPEVRITRRLNITRSALGTALDFDKRPGTVLSTGPGGHVQFNSIVFRNITSEHPDSTPPSSAFDQVNGTATFFACIFYTHDATDFRLAAAFEAADPAVHQAVGVKLAYTGSFSAPPSPLTIVSSTHVIDVCCRAYNGGALAFDSDTLLAALKAGAPLIYTSQNITADSSAFTDRAVTLSSPTTIYACSTAVLDLDNIQDAIRVADAGAVLLDGISISGSLVSNQQIQWPAGNTMFPGAFRLVGGANVTLANVRIITDVRHQLMPAPDQLDDYPSSVRPAYVVDQQGGVTIQQWDLTEAAWARSQGFSSNARASWHFRNVSILRQEQSPCFNDYPGIRVSDDLEFHRALIDPVISHIEIVANITLDPSHWPTEASGPNPQGINITRALDIRACHPTGGTYTLDFSEQGQIIFVYGYMRFMGSLQIIGSKPSARRAFLYVLVGALSVEDNGVIELTNVTINGTEPSPLNIANSSIWIDYSTVDNIVPSPGNYINVSYHRLLLCDYTFDKVTWVTLSQGRNLGGTAHWHYSDVWLQWWPATITPKTRHSTPLEVILPSVLAGLMLVAGMVACSVWWLRKHGYLTWPHDHPGPIIAPPPKGDGRYNKVDRPAGLPPAGPANGGSGGPPDQNTGSPNGLAAEDRIEEARRTLKATAVPDQNHQIVLEQLLGEGSFGRVYRGYWRGSLVAVKTMVFPEAISGKEKREKMAIMEAAISSSLSHPNVVQTYTYIIKQLHHHPHPPQLRPPQGGEGGEGGGAAGDRNAALTPLESSSSSGGPEAGRDPNLHGWEVRLVLEYCDKGSLRDALNQKLLLGPGGQPDMAKVVETALDVAHAMVHLHEENILHSDLKARNILLKSSTADSRGFCAKVADFGLSLQISPTDTHVSNFYQGTMTHMAPEVLVAGQISRASDVYSYAILLWELYTGDHAFRGMPKAYLGHEVAKLNKRPKLPASCPFEYQLLVYRCWESDASIRPTFVQILEQLKRMKANLPSPSDTSSNSPPQPPRSSSGTPAPPPATPSIPTGFPPSLPPHSSTSPSPSSTLRTPYSQAPNAQYAPPPRPTPPAPTPHGPESWDTTNSSNAPTILLPSPHRHPRPSAAANTPLPRPNLPSLNPLPTPPPPTPHGPASWDTTTSSSNNPPILLPSPTPPAPPPPPSTLHPHPPAPKPLPHTLHPVPTNPISPTRAPLPPLPAATPPPPPPVSPNSSTNSSTQAKSPQLDASPTSPLSLQDTNYLGDL